MSKLSRGFLGLFLSKSEVNAYTKQETNNLLEPIKNKGIANEVRIQTNEASITAHDLAINNLIANKAEQTDMDRVTTDLSNTIQGAIIARNDIDDINDNKLPLKQDKLTSGTNIKTINGDSILGSGDIVIDASQVDAYNKAQTDAKLLTKQDKLTSGTNIKTFNGESLIGSGNIFPFILGLFEIVSCTKSTYTVSSNNTVEVLSIPNNTFIWEVTNGRPAPMDSDNTHTIDHGYSIVNSGYRIRVDDFFLNFSILFGNGGSGGINGYRMFSPLKDIWYIKGTPVTRYAFNLRLRNI